MECKMKAGGVGVEWLLTEQCNFDCSYCGLYNNKILPNYDEDSITAFLKKIKARQMVEDFEFFIFGGEPFLHRKIHFILTELKRLNIKYMFQTNLSNKSTSTILDLYLTHNIIPLAFNISCHIEQMSTTSYIKNLMKILNIPNIWKAVNNIEVMYSGEDALKMYTDLKNEIKDKRIILCPISDFLVDGFGDTLKEYNKLKLVVQDQEIEFEDVVIEKYNTQRSLVWEEFVDKTPEYNPKGRPCLLKDRFIMYDSSFNEFNCCFHESVDQNSCPFESCFLS